MLRPASRPNKVRRSNTVVTDYDNILEVQEDMTLDCLSVEALFAEMLWEDDLDRASFPDLSETY